MSESVDRFRATAKIPPDASLRINVQVFPDRYWIGIYWSTGGGAGIPLLSQSYDRPEGKSLDDVISRARERVEKELPATWSDLRSAREAW